MSATARKLRRNAARHAATTAATLSGCRCRHDLMVHGVDHVTVKHDDWCPMRHHGSQFIIFTLPDGCQQ